MFSCFFVCLVTFFENWVFDYYNVLTRKSNSPLYQGLLLFQKLLKAVVVFLFWDFSKHFYKVNCLWCMIPEVAAPLVHIQLMFWHRFPWLLGAKTNKPLKHETIQKTLPVFANWLYSGELHQLSRFALSIGISQRGKRKVFLVLFWECLA